MDGATFDINIEAKSIGVEASAAQLNSFAEKIAKTNAVATQFDTAVAAAKTRLTEATAAAKLAAEALSLGETKYKELERAANTAAKAVEKAAAAGKDTSALQAAASAAAAKMKEESKAVDELRTKSTAAAAAQTKLAKTLKELEGQAASAATEIKKAKVPIDGAGNALKGLGANDKIEKLGKLKTAMGSFSGAAIVGAAGIALLTVAALAGIFALGAFALKANPKALEKLGAATERLKKGFMSLFTGIKLDKFVSALEDIMSLFDEGTSSANGMKALVETILQPMIDAATFLAPYVKEMFNGMIYGALQVAIFVLRARNEIFKLIPPETRAVIKDFVDKIFTMENAFKLGTAIAITLAVAIAGAAAAFVIMELPVIAIVAALGAVVAAVIWCISNWENLKLTLLGSLKDLGDLGYAIADGLTLGLLSAAPKIYKALKDIALNGIKSFKAALGISSPSKVFALQAAYTAEGYAQGLEENTPMVGEAMEAMVDPASADISAPTVAIKPGAPAQAGGSRVIHIESLVVGSGEVAQSNWEQVKKTLLELVEGAVITIGGGEVPST